MSPESESCSTRAGSGVCGGGSRLSLAPSTGSGRLGVGVEVDRAPRGTSAAALADLAALEHRRVVRRVAHLRVDLVVGRRPPRRLAAAACLDRLLLGRDVAAQDAVAELPQPGRHLVDRRRGDDQHPEEREQDQQRHHDVGGLQQVDQQLGDHEADRAAGLLERARCRPAPGSASRWRCARCRARRRAARPSRSPGGRPGRCARGRAGCARPRSTAAAARTRRAGRPSRPRRCG